MASGKIVVVIFVTALAVRLLNAPAVVTSGMPNLTPLDDLYHWKRIAFSAQHFPSVLDFDPDRGTSGAFCPWPPLYDLACGAIARICGMKAVIWIPPVASALCVGLATLLIAWQFGSLAAIAAGVALATSPFIVTESSVGDIDHHWLEWPLVFAIIFCVWAGFSRPNRLTPFLTLGIVMTIAMFVQVALLPACGLAFVILFASGEQRAAASFGIVAIIITIYRLTHPSIPTSPWFLGWPHVALFAGATIALLLRGGQAILPVRTGKIACPPLALAAGTAVALAFPSSIAIGVHFFGGDPWLSTISEFQPVWKGNIHDWMSHAFGFSIGAILVFDLARRAIRNRDWKIGAVALFALAYFPLAISSRRFEATAIPLLALAGAADAAMILRRNLRMVAAAAIAVIPAVQLAIWMSHPLPVVAPEQQSWIHAATFLRTQPPGRILAPWPLGHCLDVLGSHAVVIDNFGTMPDADLFWRAEGALQSGDVNGFHVRYVIRPNKPSGRFKLVYSENGLNLWESLDIP
jgi:asparagine N-glycosylation enzyme membrane subunit Stt3